MSPTPQVVRVRAMDTPVAIEMPPALPGLAATVTQAWSRCAGGRDDQAGVSLRLRIGTAESIESPETAVDGAGTHDVEAEDEPMLMERLSQWVTYVAIARQAGRFVMLHAGCVADPSTGECVALVGDSGAGKTTAVERLGSRFAYVTDETVAVDEDLRVVAYPKPLSVAAPGGDVKRQVGPDELDLVSLPQGDLRLRRVLLLDRDPAHQGGARVEELPLVEAIAYLAPSTSFLTRLATPLARLAGLAAAGPILGVRYQEAEDLAPVVAALLEEPR